MADILAITGPIFLLIGLGYASVRAGLYPKASLPALGGFVITFCIPALLLRSLSQRRWAEVANLDYLAAYALGSLAVLAALRLVGPVAAPLLWALHAGWDVPLPPRR